MANNKNKKKVNNLDNETMENFLKLITNIHMLHHDIEGCPWNKSQTNESLIPYLLEETNELISALVDGNTNNIIEELGDILLQIILHSEIGSKNKEFNLNDVIKYLNKKIVFRHPYIFDQKKKITIEEANKIWKKQKQLEQK